MGHFLGDCPIYIYIYFKLSIKIGPAKAGPAPPRLRHPWISRLGGGGGGGGGGGDNLKAEADDRMEMVNTKMKYICTIKALYSK